MNTEHLHKRAEEIKHGLCVSMSYVGILPSELEAALNNTTGEEKKAEGVFSTVKSVVSSPAAMLSATKDHILSLMGLGLAVGAAGGIGTAVARHKLETIANSSEDSEMRKKRMRVEAYSKMVNELKTDMASV